MNRRLLLSLLAVAAAALGPGSALAGTLTLHPAGFGPHSYSSWKAKQGLPDDIGNDSQALYFQKLTTTPTNAAGVAIIKGIAGTPASQLTGLAWDHRDDGHCGAGAPRWNVLVQNTMTGIQQNVFLGCSAAQHTPLPNGSWCHDDFTPKSALTAQLVDLSLFTIEGLAIVFDEGTDTPNPEPAPCPQAGSTSGFVYLDDIELTANGVTKCWTSADDNANNRTGPCPPIIGEFAAGAPGSFDVPAGVPVDATDTEFMTALGFAFPGVSPPSWVSYPNVVY